MHSRVKTYRRRCKVKGKWVTLTFNNYHAEEVGTSLEEDGMALDKAIALVKKWNLMGNRYGWEYYIPFVKKELTA